VGGETEEATSIVVQDDAFILIAGKTRNTTNNFDFSVLRYQNGLTGVDDMDKKNTYSVYPNPIKSGDAITITNLSGGVNITRMECVNKEGKLVFTRAINSSNSAIQTTLNLPAGSYDLQLFDHANFLDSMKIIITE